ncbi:MAG: arylsulfatase A-like enzyme [Planctomycetota bacterium]|jgi:arylsulfatase A-like enzyme
MRPLTIAWLLLASCSTDVQDPLAPAGLVPGTPNLLVITLDTTRADHLGCYGYFRDTSPNLDALAAESLLFERCIVPMATTLPTHVSLFTGTYPHEHGVIANLLKDVVYERDPRLVTVAEYLRDVGYTTAAFVSALPLRAEAGLVDGFEVYSYTRSHLRRASDTLDTTRAWLGKRAKPPFFLWVHLFDPHGPYDPPEEAQGRFDTDADLREWMAAREVIKEAERKGGKAIDIEDALNAYDAEIAYMDAQLGLFFDDLRERGLWEDLVIVVMGDHGEGLGQHGLPGHGRAYDEQLHAPLMIKAPGLAPGRYSDPVSAVDVLPSLLHLLELPGKTEFLVQTTGVNRFAATGGAELKWIMSQSSPRQADGGKLEYALSAERWKYLRSADGQESLFDLAADPYELVDVAAEHPEVLGECRERLNSRLARQLARQGGSQRQATGEELRGLEGLGYGGDDED